MGDFSLSIAEWKNSYICRDVLFLTRYVIRQTNRMYFHFLEEGILLLFLRTEQAFWKVVSEKRVGIIGDKSDWAVGVGLEKFLDGSMGKIKK